MSPDIRYLLSARTLTRAARELLELDALGLAIDTLPAERQHPEAVAPWSGWVASSAAQGSDSAAPATPADVSRLPSSSGTVDGRAAVEPPAMSVLAGSRGALHEPVAASDGSVFPAHGRAMTRPGSHHQRLSWVVRGQMSRWPRRSHDGPPARQTRGRSLVWGGSSAGLPAHEPRRLSIPSSTAGAAPSRLSTLMTRVAWLWLLLTAVWVAGRGL